MNRRNFIWSLGSVFLANNMVRQLQAAIRNSPGVKPIEGSWIEFQHHNPAEGKYWDETLKAFSAEQWDAKVKEIADAGIKYLVLLSVAINDKAFYPSSLQPPHEMGCEDPLEVVLSAADKYGVKFFISNGYLGNWRNIYEVMTDPSVDKLRSQVINEVAEKYAHHDSFYGWYFPDETGITGYFEDFFIDYVNRFCREMAKVTPGAKTLIAPYGTRNVKADDTYVSQLEQLEVDFIAYQDEVGVEKSSVEESALFFERLYKLHQKAAKSRLWADVEVFCFEGQVYKSALLPAPADRVIQQLQAVSPYVEKIFIYQYPGLMNKPGSRAFAGHLDSENLYMKLLENGFIAKR